MEAKHKEIRTSALRVNDREGGNCDMGRQVSIWQSGVYACVAMVMKYTTLVMNNMLMVMK